MGKYKVQVTVVVGRAIVLNQTLGQYIDLLHRPQVSTTQWNHDLHRYLHRQLVAVFSVGVPMRPDSGRYGGSERSLGAWPAVMWRQ